jgi:hypothetical protein
VHGPASTAACQTEPRAQSVAIGAVETALAGLTVVERYDRLLYVLDYQACDLSYCGKCREKHMKKCESCLVRFCHKEEIWWLKTTLGAKTDCWKVHACLGW